MKDSLYQDVDEENIFNSCLKRSLIFFYILNLKRISLTNWHFLQSKGKHVHTHTHMCMCVWLFKRYIVICAYYLIL